ncbi:MAG: 3-isopropylmalate dehydratase small subunit [Candidatus Nanohalarchaeota archaeon]|nr:MAG: 3-isopropylmalate dehydratase small subunit [Candidatus Nanohaloarchaeota archaeon]
MTNIIGRAIPKPANDQNTDDILPARYMKEITFKKMGEYVYFDERFKEGKIVKEHPFNDEKYKGATILIAGANYGCGSSREHAPQALHRFGINAVIAGSFAEIFAGNCASLGLVGIVVPPEKITMLAEYVEQKPSTEFDIDLAQKVIRYDEHVVEFDMPEGRRQAFLNGLWDAMAILEQNEGKIKETAAGLPYLKFR